MIAEKRKLFFPFLFTCSAHAVRIQCKKISIESASPVAEHSMPCMCYSAGASHIKCTNVAAQCDTFVAVLMPMVGCSGWMARQARSGNAFYHAADSTPYQEPVVNCAAHQQSEKLGGCESVQPAAPLQTCC